LRKRQISWRESSVHVFLRNTFIKRAGYTHHVLDCGVTRTASTGGAAGFPGRQHAASH